MVEACDGQWDEVEGLSVGLWVKQWTIVSLWEIMRKEWVNWLAECDYSWSKHYRMIGISFEEWVNEGPPINWSDERSLMISWLAVEFEELRGIKWT